MHAVRGLGYKAHLAWLVFSYLCYNFAFWTVDLAAELACYSKIHPRFYLLLFNAPCIPEAENKNTCCLCYQRSWERVSKQRWLQRLNLVTWFHCSTLSCWLLSLWSHPFVCQRAKQSWKVCVWSTWWHFFGELVVTCDILAKHTNVEQIWVFFSIPENNHFCWNNNCALFCKIILLNAISRWWWVLNPWYGQRELSLWGATGMQKQSSIF